eukprot:2440776-Karenia_brevis.AAC.1
MQHIVDTTLMRVAGRIEFVWDNNTLYANPDALRTSVGAVINIQNKHWVALRRIGEQVWLLDSQEPSPHPFTNSEYKAFISKHREAFPIRQAMEMHIS